MQKILMIFVDGLGLAQPSPTANPINSEICPNLTKALHNHATPIDAILGVPGTPQSATGQTSLLTGINAQKKIGRHVEGFPGPSLRKIICKHNIFEQLKKHGLKSTFANGYLSRNIEDIHNLRIKSVTTVAALSAFGDVRRGHMLEKNQSVSHDIIRDTLASRGYTGPQITPEQAAQDLINIANQHSFTLFEYFLTDRAGHTTNIEKAKQALQRLDALLVKLLNLIKNGEITLILTSDHGNIEDLRTRSHTTNPIPFLAYGPNAKHLRNNVKNLTHITPELVKMLKDS